MPETTGYPEIAEYLRKQIKDGTLQPGDTLPSFKAIGKQFGVAQTTVNRAYRLLKMEGLTLAKPGVGTVVAAPRSNGQQRAELEDCDLTDFNRGEELLAAEILKYTEAAHRFYEESQGHDASPAAQETCLNLAHSYSVLARRAAERLENASK